MAQVTITINCREYAVACEDGQEVRIMQLARVLDEKARMITSGAGQVNENMLLAMVGLLLADEINELKREDIFATTKHETSDKSRIVETDRQTAEKIKNLTSEIKSVASGIKLL